MKKIFFFLSILVFVNNISFAQNRSVARGAEPGELYLACGWYGIYNPTGMYYDTLQTAIYRITENGKKLTIQYDIDAFANPADTVVPYAILADATLGVIYAKTYYANSGFRTSLWVSFDYGKNWIHREENIGQKIYFSANHEGLAYRGGGGVFKSFNYGETFSQEHEGGSCHNCDMMWDVQELFSVGSLSPYQGRLYHTYDFFRTYTEIPIDSQFMFGKYNFPPDVYRGGLLGEAYVSSWFPDNRYRVSFSVDTGHTFRHVYVSDVYPPGGNSYPFFMSDREPGVFYILKAEQIEDFNPWGHHTKICIEYYRDYGETLVATYCHDLHKNYGKSCEAVNDLVSEKIDNNSILLTWGEPESSLPVTEYHVYRNDELLSVTTNTTFVDENLSVGEYEYYVITNYEMNCVSDSSNHVKVEIEVGVEEYLQPNFSILPNPATNQVIISSASPFHTVEIINLLGQTLVSQSVIGNSATLNISNLNNGIYFVRVVFEGGSSVKKLGKQ